MTDCRDHRHEEEGGAFPIQEKTELEGKGDCKWSMSPLPSPPCSTLRILLPCRDGDTLIPKWVWTLGRTLSGDPDIQGAVGTGQRT